MLLCLVQALLHRQPLCKGLGRALQFLFKVLQIFTRTKLYWFVCGLVVSFFLPLPEPFELLPFNFFLYSFLGQNTFSVECRVSNRVFSLTWHYVSSRYTFYVCVVRVFVCVCVPSIFLEIFKTLPLLRKLEVVQFFWRLARC